MKRVAIVQSNYIPWKGYFDIIHDVDTFIFYDDVQYTTRDWRNRNRIKTDSGPQWLTVPVGSHRHRRTCDVALPSDPAWAEAHWRRIERSYRTAPWFEHYQEYFEALYRGRTWTTLSEMNQAFVRGIARDLLGLTTRFECSTDYSLSGTKGARLIDLLTQAGAGLYVSGPAARAYLAEDDFARAGIQLEWKNYEGYPEYPQLHGPFRHDVSILDLLFHTGNLAPSHIWGWRQSREAAA
jgi:hypothetical protein